MKNAHSLGITACASNDTSEGYDFDSITEAYRDIYDESLNSGSPALRVTLQCSISGSEELLNKFIKRDIYLKPLWETVSRDGDKAQRPNWGTFLKAGSIKLFMDGSLGGQTAWMRRPYVDKPETKGIPVLETETLNRIVRKASDNGMQVLVHAIGDAAIEAVIAAFEKVTYAGKNPLRHGVIHTQITTPDLLERMARNKILSLIQPVFLADDMPILESRVGKELALTSYAWGSMHKMGIPVSYGTDSSVCPMDPLANIQWAVLREPGEGMEIQGFPYSLTNHAEKVDVYTAVDAYTEGSAYSGYFDSIGRIAPGFFADLCFLDRDIFAIPPEGIHKAKVTRTMCAGETVFLA
jgi:predicted amidohydrolase YtcJ